MDSCFVLIGTRQHCLAKICNASPTANAHKLQSDPFTISSSVLWPHLLPETKDRALSFLVSFGVSKRFLRSISLAIMIKSQVRQKVVHWIIACINIHINQEVAMQTDKQFYWFISFHINLSARTWGWLFVGDPPMLAHDFRQIEERTLGMLCCAISVVFLFLDFDVLHGSSKQGESLTLNQEKWEIVSVVISLLIIIIITNITIIMIL